MAGHAERLVNAVRKLQLYLEAERSETSSQGPGKCQANARAKLWLARKYVSHEGSGGLAVRSVGLLAETSARRNIPLDDFNAEVDHLETVLWSI